MKQLAEHIYDYRNEKDSKSLYTQSPLVTTLDSAKSKLLEELKTYRKCIAEIHKQIISGLDIAMHLFRLDTCAFGILLNI